MKSEGEIKAFTNKKILRDFVTTRPVQEEHLKEALNMEMNNWYNHCKNIPKCKDHQHEEEAASNNKKNNQLES